MVVTCAFWPAFNVSHAFWILVYLDKRLSGAIVLCAQCDTIALEPVSLWCRYTNALWEPEQEEMVQFRQRESVAIEDNNASITSQQEGEEFVVIS